MTQADYIIIEIGKLTLENTALKAQIDELKAAIPPKEKE